MRDNKIIKALEYLTYGGNFCLRCEHKIITGDNRCGIDGCNIAKKALDLINRLEAEIERLECSIISQDEEKLSYAAMLIKEEQERIRLEQIRRLEAEIERLQKVINTDIVFVGRRQGKTQEANRLIRLRVEEIKSEAIKEFAERLCEGRVSNDPVVIAVKVELKEMRKEDEGK